MFGNLLMAHGFVKDGGIHAFFAKTLTDGRVIIAANNDGLGADIYPSEKDFEEVVNGEVLVVNALDEKDLIEKIFAAVE